VPPGTPSNDANDQETSAYNALGELVWKKDQAGTEHVFEFDDRGRQIHDRATVLGAGLSTAIRMP
jgi:YD repeat-containing protein